MLCENAKSATKSKAPSKLGLVLDGWTRSKRHFLATFAQLDASDLKRNVLLSTRQLGRATSQNAQSHADSTVTVTGELGFSQSSVVYTVADSTRLGPAASSLLRAPFTGCASHRLACAVKFLLLPFRALLDKASAAVVDLSSSSNRVGALKQYTSLETVSRSETRWTSQFNQLDRYTEIMEATKDHYEELEVPLQRVLAAAEEGEMLALYRKLKCINDVTIKLQDAAATVLEARDLFDMLDFPGLGSQIQVTSDLIAKSSSQACSTYSRALL